MKTDKKDIDECNKLVWDLCSNMLSAGYEPHAISATFLVVATKIYETTLGSKDTKRMLQNAINSVKED